MKFPDAPTQDELMHYGVLGMKWGHRRSATGQQIYAARRRLSTEQNKRADLVDAKRATAKGSSARAKVDRQIKAHDQAFLNNPDRVIASRLTRGEKAIALLFAGPSGGATLGSIVGSSAYSRRIEYKQDNGLYNKKK